MMQMVAHLDTLYKHCRHESEAIHLLARSLVCHLDIMSYSIYIHAMYLKAAYQMNTLEHKHVCSDMPCTLVVYQL